MPTIEPAREYFKNISRSVSSPTKKSKTIEATVVKPYSSYDIGKFPYIGNSACPNQGSVIPPNRYGPITIPAAISPIIAGMCNFSKSIPLALAAKSIIPSCKTSIIILSNIT